jgi:2-keto-4-pentenoate hydratase
MDVIAQAVRALVTARQTGIAVSTVPLAEVDSEAAYAVQDGVAQTLGWFADKLPRHWKSGAPSPHALQTHAPLPPAGVWASPADARHWPFHARGIEAEIALRLGCDVDAALAAVTEPEGIGALVDAMCVAIEIVDSRWLEAGRAPAMARLADLQSHGALVLGDWLPFQPRDWSAQVCRVAIGSAAVAEFRGSHSLGDPLRVLPNWLRHVTRGGRLLPAGTMVTTGTWCGLPEAGAGDRVRVEFSGLGSAEVQF